MQIANNRIFITGGAGFIGTALTRRLVDDNEIVIYDNLHRDAISNSGLLQHKNVKFIRGDVLDFEHLKEVMYCELYRNRSKANYRYDIPVTEKMAE